MKIGAKVVRHGRYVTFQLAEVAIPLPLFAEILQLIAGQVQAVRRLSGRTFLHTWMLAEALARESGEWRPREKTTENKAHNKRLQKNLDFVFRAFRVGE